MSEKTHSIAVVTKDRPEGLQRCLESYLKNSNDFSQVVDVFIGDDSEIYAEQNQTLLRGIAKKYRNKIYYLGQAEKNNLIEKLVERKLNRDVLEFSLKNSFRFDFAAGSNKNALLLSTIGRKVLLVDDDSICEVNSTKKNEIIKIDQVPQRIITLFRDKKDLIQNISKENVNFLNVHFSTLGKRISETLNVSSEDFRVFSDFENKKIRLSWTGFYGDSGIKHPSFVYNISGSIGEVIKDERTFRSFQSSRQIHCFVKSATISNHQIYPSAAIGLDNSEMLPPYTPFLRGEDKGFALLVKHCFQDSLIQFLPYSVGHFPIESRQYDLSKRFDGAKSLRFLQFYSGLVRQFDRAATGPSLRSLGKALHLFAKQNIEKFCMASKEICTKPFQVEIANLDRLLKSKAGFPDFWKDDVIELRQTYLSTLERESFFVPDDISEGTPLDKMKMTREVIEKMGRLLILWPDIYEESQKLIQKGLEFGRLL